MGRFFVLHCNIKIFGFTEYDAYLLKKKRKEKKRKEKKKNKNKRKVAMCPPPSNIQKKTST